MRWAVCAVVKPFSGIIRREIGIEPLEAGMNAHLPKPLDADRLYAELDRWINGSMKMRIEEI